MVSVRRGLRCALLTSLFLSCGVHGAALSLQDVANVRSPFSVSPSPDGQWLLYGFNASPDIYARRAGLQHLASGKFIELRPAGLKEGSFTIATSAWNPAGTRIAYVVEQGGAAQLRIRELGSGKDSVVEGFMAVAKDAPLVWSADGTQILTLMSSPAFQAETARLRSLEEQIGYLRHEIFQFPEVGPDRPSVVEFHSPNGTFAADAPKAQQKPTPPAPLVLIDVDRGTFRQLTLADSAQRYWYSPDGKHIAYLTKAGVQEKSQQNLKDLSVLEVATGTVRVLGRGLALHWGNLRWSPDSTRVAYATQGQKATGEIVIVSIQSGEPKSYRLEGPASFNLGAWTDQAAPLWDADGRAVYALASDGKLWRVSTEDSAVTVAAQIAGTSISEVLSSRNAPALTIDRDRIWVRARNPQTQMDAIYTVNLKGGATTKLIEEDATLRDFALNLPVRTIVYRRSTRESAGDLWQTEVDTGARRRITHLNPGYEKTPLGATQIIEWKGVDGKTLQGALILPPNYRAGMKVPLVMWLYGSGMGSQNKNTFGLVSTGFFDMQTLATRGYAVLFPDAPTNVGTPVKDIVNAMNGAADRAIETGYIDADRLAIMGHSYGSYSVMSAITHTNRFKAAVISGIIDMDPRGGYLYMLGSGAASGIGYYESGQGMMGGSPWEFPDRYRDNSLMPLLDRVQTPLLMAQGEANDGPLRWPSALFVALRRLGKPVDFYIYKGEDHGFLKPYNIVDFWQRRLEFLARNLNIAVSGDGEIVFANGRAQARTRQ